jgi:RNA polymerase sigma-70 factor (ECF subfamily)
MTDESEFADRPDGEVDPPDAELVARTCAGDATAFDALVRRHYRAAFAVALSQTGNRVDAEDVCHDALVRAAERLEDCRNPDHFVHWLCAIVRNHARNAIARAHVRRAGSLDHHTAASGSDSAHDAERAELRARLERALVTLTPVQREVVLLHDLDGWTHEAIGATLGTSAGMSRQHLFHARKRLREVLGPASTEYFNDR